MGGIERLREAHGARAEAAGQRSSCLALNLWPAGGADPLPLSPDAARDPLSHRERAGGEGEAHALWAELSGCEKR